MPVADPMSVGFGAVTEDADGATDDGSSGVLTIGFSDGSAFTVTPDAEEDDDAEHWELFTPENLFLAQGPIGRFKVRKTDAL